MEAQEDPQQTEKPLTNGVRDDHELPKRSGTFPQRDETTNREGSTTYPKRELCYRCQVLNIREDKFLVNGRQPKRGGSPPRASTSFKGTLKTSSSKLELGTLWEVYKHRDSCAVCLLIWKSTGLQDAPAEYGGIRSAQCYANWEVDGRGVKLASCGTIIESNNLTRRIHIRWSDSSLDEAYIILVIPTNYVRPNSDAPHSWRSDDLFLGREIKTLGKNQALMSSWLSACNNDHGERCKVGHDRKFARLVNSSYFGVIDVIDLMLCQLPPDEHYVALSYVWGKQTEKAQYKTLLENISLHKAHGGLEAVIEHLPRTIRDAMEVCRKLRIRYLWVDTLCLVQDSKRSWALNAASMDTIYGNAHLTICAADGKDAHAGLVAIHNTSERQRQPISQYGRLLLTTTKLAETGIQRSEWNKRAWTFCERMLSKRCLIFTQGHMFFQCRSTAMSEDIVAEPKGAGWSLGLVNAPLQILRELKPGRRPFWVYANCVQLYTQRKLTFANDVLHAFYGMANLLAEKMASPLVFGLPASHFDLALLWTQTGPMERRVPKDIEDSNKWGDEDFPTWSWCGWKAPDGFPASSIQYDPEMLDGSVRNINEWLCKHTWIHWYIRDGHGDLRAIFRSPEAPEGRDRELAMVRKRRGYYSDEDADDDRPSFDSDQPRDVIVTIAEETRTREREVMPRNRRDDIENEYRQRESKQPRRIVLAEDGYAAHSNGRFNDYEYGRELGMDVWTQNRGDFRRPLPEYPFSVNMADPRSKPSVEFPDQKYLQFHTWTAWLHIHPNEDAEANVGDGLARHDIADATGDWVGTIVLDKVWAARQVRTEFEFVALSDAKAFTEQENPVWTFYLPKEKHQSLWDLYFVLLVERGRGGVAKRVGLGKVFKDAFNNACHPGKAWSEVILA